MDLIKNCAAATLLVFLVAGGLAYLISRKEFAGKSMLEALFLLPMILPPTVVGFGLLYFFGRNAFFGELLENVFGVKIVFTWYAVLLAAVVVSFPLMFQSAKAAFQQYDIRLERAGFTMGASRLRVFRTISFPLA
jgi:molybdate transport system permease protein